MAQHHPPHAPAPACKNITPPLFQRDNLLLARYCLTGLLLALPYFGVLLLLYRVLPYPRALIAMQVGVSSGRAMRGPGALLAIVMLGGAQYISGTLVLLRTGAQLVNHRQEPYLHGLVERIGNRLNRRKPRIAILETRAYALMVRGRDPEHATLVISRAALEKLSAVRLDALLEEELQQHRSWLAWFSRRNRRRR